MLVSSTKGNDSMEEREIIAIIMTICEYLGHSPSAPDVQQRYQANLHEATTRLLFPGELNSKNG
jgi:hypothetical protein